MEGKKIPQPMHPISWWAGCPGIVGMCRVIPNVEAVNKHDAVDALASATHVNSPSLYVL